MLPPFIASYLVAIAATPLAIRIAARSGFLDRPVGYKAHSRATPYLGGAAVLAGFLAGALIYGAVGDSRLTPIFVGAAFLWLVGTIDDRMLLGPRIRVVSVVLAGAALWYGDLGWTLFANDLANLAVTVLWVLGIVNAFNLMDNLDGAAATVAGVCAAGIALVAAYEGPEVVAALSVAVCGACIGFLHFNLTRPARIFMGDGGSMLLGFLIAALAMTVWRLNGMAGTAFLPAILLAGLPIFDMTLVIVSRLRRGAPVYKGGRDHTTHRLLPKVGSTWAVALTLALGQGALSLAAFELMDASRSAMLVGAGIAFVLGVATIVAARLTAVSGRIRRAPRPATDGLCPRLRGRISRRSRRRASPGNARRCRRHAGTGRPRAGRCPGPAPDPDRERRRPSREPTPLQSHDGCGRLRPRPHDRVDQRPRAPLRERFGDHDAGRPDRRRRTTSGFTPSGRSAGSPSRADCAASTASCARSCASGGSTPASRTWRRSSPCSSPRWPSDRGSRSCSGTPTRA